MRLQFQILCLIFMIFLSLCIEIYIIFFGCILISFSVDKIHSKEKKIYKSLLKLHTRKCWDSDFSIHYNIVDLYYLHIKTKYILCISLYPLNYRYLRINSVTVAICRKLPAKATTSVYAIY